MCNFCDNFNFGSVGYDFAYGEKCPSIYFPGRVGDVAEDQRFKFCPVCGGKLTARHFGHDERGRMYHFKLILNGIEVKEFRDTEERALEMARKIKDEAPNIYAELHNLDTDAYTEIR